MTWSLLAWSSQPRRDAQSQSFTSWSMWDRKRVTSPRRHLEKEGGRDEGSWPTLSGASQHLVLSTHGISVANAEMLSQSF